MWERPASGGLRGGTCGRSRSLCLGAPHVAFPSLFRKRKVSTTLEGRRLGVSMAVGVSVGKENYRSTGKCPMNSTSHLSLPGAQCTAGETVEL